MELEYREAGDVSANGIPYLSVVSQEDLSRVRKSHAWRKLSMTVKEEEPICRLQLPGCAQITTCVDHIIPASQRPDLFLVRSNCQGSCTPCNLKRGDKPLSSMTPPRALEFFDTTTNNGKVAG